MQLRPYALLTLCLGSAGLSAAASYVTFDAPGGTSTYAFAINSSGTVTGNYIDVNNAYHGFVRTSGGAFTSFDVPGAARGTTPLGINDGGAVVGWWEDANSGVHGFTRGADGAITSFDAPGAGHNGTNQGTTPKSINSLGVITGYYGDSTGFNHAFLRAADGTFTTFDAPGVGCPQWYMPGTFATSINLSGAVTGYFVDNNCMYHGFLRAADGSFTILDAPTASNGGGKGTEAVSLNDSGAVGGTAVRSSSHYFAFLRNSSGVYATLNDKSSTTAINSSGTIAGQVIQGPQDTIIGFVWTPGSPFVQFAVPGYFDTYPSGINAAGVITGQVRDSAGYHGFLRNP